jgi:phosphotransferase system  glucose/maltose/N-acetylglucosamine-specific IIC component
MKSFYLKNYKTIHHIFTLASFIGMLLIIGLKEIFTSIPFMLMILVINYFIVKFCLKQSGLDEEVEEQLKNIENKKESK